MNFDFDPKPVEFSQDEAEAIADALSEAIDQRDRATWEACARAFGHNNEIEIWKRFKEWQESNIPEEPA